MQKNYLHFKKIATGLLLVLAVNTGRAQNYFTWMKGNSGANQSGVYGTQGVSAAANKPGGRELPVSWKDAAGNLWLYGGYSIGSGSALTPSSDLWKYTVASNEWTWVSGSSMPNQLGVYGTKGVAAPTNKPGAKEGAVSWTDAAGNFWLFGGIGVGSNSVIAEMNDLWKYDVATNQWTWMSGSTISMQSGVYGTQGVATASTVPGSRTIASSWADAQGNLWLFGGSGYDASSASYGDMNDLWKYNIATGQWTWMSGSNLKEQSDMYGIMGVASATATPGARYLSMTWTDASGNLWLTGGSRVSGLPGQMQENFHSDIWKFDITTSQWTWVSGSSVPNQPGVYGTMGVAAATNKPGSRSNSVTWKDSGGNVFLFGGWGFDHSGATGAMNDLWKYNMTTDTWTWIAGNDVVFHTASYGSQGVPAATNVPGSRTGACGWVDALDNLWLFGGTGNITSAGVIGQLNDLWRFSSCTSASSISIATSNTVICAGTSAALTASGGALYSWNTTPTQTASVIYVSSVENSTYTVIGTDFNGCNDTASIALRVDMCTGIASQIKQAAGYAVYPNPNNGYFTISGDVAETGTSLMIFNTLGQQVTNEPLHANNVNIETHLQKGIYYYTIVNGTTNISSGKLIVE